MTSRPADRRGERRVNVGAQDESRSRASRRRGARVPDMSPHQRLRLAAAYQRRKPARRRRPVEAKTTRRVRPGRSEQAAPQRRRGGAQCPSQPVRGPALEEERDTRAIAASLRNRHFLPAAD